MEIGFVERGLPQPPDSIPTGEKGPPPSRLRFRCWMEEEGVNRSWLPMVRLLWRKGVRVVGFSSYYRNQNILKQYYSKYQDLLTGYHSNQNVLNQYYSKYPDWLIGYHRTTNLLKQYYSKYPDWLIGYYRNTDLPMLH